MTTDLNNGQLLAKRYRLVELIGKGAMGRVYRAEDTFLGNVTVAIKFLSQSVLNEKSRERFEQEATISALLGEKSIHIVRVRDYGLDKEESPFYVMEYLEGKDLNETIKHNPLSLPQFLKYTRHICLGLKTAHEGIRYKGDIWHIIHRDIKPSNILIVRDATLGEMAKILDFGVAKMVQPDATQTHTFMGTLAYASPEQMEGEELDERSDIYSLGVMMYEMLSCELPVFPENRSFGGWYSAHREDIPNPLDASLKIPKPLEELVMRCLAKSRRDRPQNTTEILDVLDNLQASIDEYDRSEQRLALSLVEAKQSDLDRLTELAEQACINSIWPKNKPQREIVFPRIIRVNDEDVFATLWVMLRQKDIEQLEFSTRYNYFLCTMAPHPMLLWITVLYNGRDSPRWLPCYLDLKTSVGQRIARSLGTVESYRILFFAAEGTVSQRCKQVIPVKIDPHQSQMLLDWANASQLNSGSDPSLSKYLLKQELEKLKPKITMKLEAVYAF